MNNKIVWENVYVFISSTFNDMHAERDFLVKRVFPELRLWCAKRRLKLIDIDLRWGVSEKDATENKRVVDVCLQNIDKCRPFFLCFLGQRRGWVPTEMDVNSKTCTSYPQLKDYLGKNSVTELEIIHALFNPLDCVNESARHTFFYFRNPDYISSIESSQMRELFAPAGVDVDLESFKQMIQKKHPVLTYEARWNPQKVSPELVNVKGKDLSKGRLEHFTVNGDSLKNSILEQLKAAIEEEFPGRDRILESASELESELMHQGNFLFQSCDSYIPRPKEEKKILDYYESEDHFPYILKARAGSGKTSMLAHLLSEKRIPGQVFYRFAGTSADSANAQRTLYLLAQEMISCNLLKEEELKKEEKNILLGFPNLLNAASARGAFTILLDAIDQWSRAADDILWIPQRLPDNVKLVISVRADGNSKLLDALERRCLSMHTLEEMSSREEKILFIQQYLSQFLKDISEEQIELILNLEGTNNPLYLKIVLNELRIHGSFDTLVSQLEKNYGKTPADAFQLVLERLETEEYSALIKPGLFTMIFLGVMAYSLEAVNIEKYADIFCELSPKSNFDPVEIMDGVYTLARHLSPYLVMDGVQINFLYDSFRRAVKERYGAYEKNFHGILSAVYFRYCWKQKKGFRLASRSDMICLAHHILYSSEEKSIRLFSDADYFLEFVKKAGTLHVSETMALADELGYQKPAFKELADCLRSCSVRIDGGPNTLFYELREEIGTTNVIVKSLLEQASSRMNLQYFAPMMRKEIATAIPYREMNYKEFPIRSKIYPLEEHLAYVTFPRWWEEKETKNSVIYIQNLENEKIESSYEFPYAISHCSVDKNDLYIESIADDDNKKKIEIYTLPSLECKFSSMTWPDLPEGFRWLNYCHGYNGNLYEAAISRTLPMCIRIYCLNDGKMVHETVYPVESTKLNEDHTINTLSLRLDFAGPFFSEHSGDHCSQKVWFLPSDTMIYEDTQEYDHFYGAIDGDIFYYCKNSKKKMVYQYQFTDSKVTLLQKKELPSQSDFSIDCAEAALDYLFIHEYSGAVRVYDKELDFVGYLQNGFGVSYTDLLPKHLYSYKGNLQLVESNRMHFYKIDKFLADLNPEPGLSKLSGSRSPFIHGKYLYLMGASYEKINLETLKSECEERDVSYQFLRSDPENHVHKPEMIYRIGGKEYALGTYNTQYTTNRYYVVLRSLDSLKLGMYYENAIPNGMLPDGAYYNDWKFGVVFKEDLSIYDYKKLQIQMFSIGREIVPDETWEPDVRCKEHEVIRVPGSGDYLICFNCYVDDAIEEIRIYDLYTRSLVLTHPHDLAYSFHSYNIYERNGRLYFTAYIRKTKTVLFYEINPAIGEMVCNTVSIPDLEYVNLVNVTDDSAFFYSRDTKKIGRFSLKTHDYTQIIDIHERPGCIYVFEKYGAILSFQCDGICDVYSKDTGEHILRQVFKQEIKNVVDCPNQPWFYLDFGHQECNFYGLSSTKHLLSTL